MKKILNQIESHRLISLILFWSIYGLLFLLAEHLIQKAVWIVYNPLDQYIPFTRFAIPGYYLWFVVLVYTEIKYWRKANSKDFLLLFVSMFLATIPVLLFYFLVPNGLDIRPNSVEGNDLFAWMMRFIWAADTPLNVCPSLHVSTTVVLDLCWSHSSFLEGKNKWWVHLIDVIICASTVLLKQHSLTDVICGFLVAVLSYALAEKINTNF